MTTTNADITNRALQTIGTRTTVTDAELAAQSTNEAIQASLVIEHTRKELLRMAPWDCALSHANLVYITSAPGTPENQTQLQQWDRGVPAPPWGYEYQYPVDCLRACWIVPQMETGLAGNVPIFPVTTGWSPTVWVGPAVKYKVGIDQFMPVTGVVVAFGGSGYVVGEVVTLATTPAGSAPIGAPAKVRVLTIGVSGTLLTAEIVTQVLDATVGGSYFNVQSNPVAQSASTGSGSGATFNLTFGTEASQRVILTNQEFAILAFVKNITEIDIMDPLFQNAWIHILGGRICYALTSDRNLANDKIKIANESIIAARTADGNEGLTVDDRTPDWLRVRGINYPNGSLATGFDWGGLWPLF